MQVPGASHLGGQHGFVSLPVAGQQVTPASHASRMNDALHRADLAPDFCKNLFNLRGIRDIAVEGGKGHALQRMGRQLAASVQQNHACAITLMNLARQRLAHAAKAAGNHHAAVLCYNGHSG